MQKVKRTVLLPYAISTRLALIHTRSVLNSRTEASLKLKNNSRKKKRPYSYSRRNVSIPFQISSWLSGRTDELFKSNKLLTCLFRSSFQHHITSFLKSYSRLKNPKAFLSINTVLRMCPDRPVHYSNDAKFYWNHSSHKHIHSISASIHKIQLCDNSKGSSTY